MRSPKITRYTCGNGEGMFENNRNGGWVEHSEHRAVMKHTATEFAKWMRKEDTPINAEKYAGFTDDDMYNLFIKTKK